MKEWSISSAPGDSERASDLQRLSQRIARKRSALDSFTPIGPMIDRWLRKNRAKDRVHLAGVFEAWSQAVRAVGVSEVAGDQTRVLDFRRGELIVAVSSSPLLNELSTFYSQELLRVLRGCEELKGLRKIRFRQGAF